MICRAKPLDAKNYFVIKHKDLLRHLMNKGVHPLYFADGTYYFIKTDMCYQCIEEWNRQRP